MKQIRLLLTGWSHVTCLMSNANVDPWDMLNNFCFHVYAQMSLFVGENDNGYFQLGTSSMNSNVTGEGDEGVQKNHCNFRLYTATFDPRHENKNCSACPEDQLELF